MLDLYKSTTQLITLISITVTIDGQLTSVPIDPANTHYAEILKQVESGDLTIAEAD